ncbi:NAD(P)/FAD-dependent oxidoreductase, partial [[Clostridium] symbiosum]
ICCGGADVREIAPESMESKLKKGLYLIGELLDVDGICGGYNLQWAWSTGAIAGTHAGL